MTVVVASDLDRTLIYSRRARASLGDASAPSVCVEIHNGKPASFMTERAARQLVTLAEATTFVPVTSRIPDQYRRVTLPGRPPHFAITGSGGILLVDGVPDPAWSARIAAEQADEFPLAAVWEQVGHVCRPEFTVKLRNAAGLFCYAVVHPNKLPPGFVADVAGWAAERGWRTSLQGRKLYLVPVTLKKSAAALEVARRCDASLLLAAGDAVLDDDLLLNADFGIYPRHGELYELGWTAPGITRTKRSGILAGEEIVDWFLERSAAVPTAASARQQGE